MPQAIDNQTGVQIITLSTSNRTTLIVSPLTYVIYTGVDYSIYRSNLLKQHIGALYSLQRQELNNPVVMVLMIIWWQKEAKRQGKENENEITKQLRYFQLTCVRIRLFAVTSKSNFAFHFFFASNSWFVSHF